MIDTTSISFLFELKVPHYKTHPCIWWASAISTSNGVSRICTEDAGGDKWGWWWAFIAESTGRSRQRSQRSTSPLAPDLVEVGIVGLCNLICCSMLAVRDAEIGTHMVVRMQGCNAHAMHISPLAVRRHVSC